MRLIALFAATAVLAVACEPRPRMHVAPMVRVGDDVLVTFDQPLANRPSNQYWITLAPADSPTSGAADRIVLERGDRSVLLHASVPGASEVRLYDGYPAKSAHLIARSPTTVLYRAEWPTQGPTID